MGGIPTILYLDDSPDDRFFMQALVVRTHVTFRLLTLAECPEAIDYMSGRGRFADRRHNPEPDLLLVDLHLGGEKALNFLHWVRERPVYRLLPIVVFTGTQSAVDLQECLEAGADVCVLKPQSYSDWDRIVATLEQCFASSKPDLAPLIAVTHPFLVQQRLRSELRANVDERQRLLEQRHAISLYLDAINASQKESKKQFPFPGKRPDSELPPD